MDFMFHRDIEGRVLLEQDGYQLYGRPIDDGAVTITGVHTMDPDSLREVCIPPVIDGLRVMGIEASFCGNEWERFYIDTLHIPDHMRLVKLNLMQPRKKLLLTATGNPYLTIENGLLIDWESRTVLSCCDSGQERYVVPEGIGAIAKNAFLRCGAREIVLPESLEVIGPFAFNHAKAKAINVPAGVKEIGAYAFMYCDVQHLTLHGGMKMGRYAFSGCDLRTLEIEEGLLKIEDDAFWNCTQLRRVEIGRGLKKIGARAFGSCYSLRELILPQGIISIGDRAFDKCINLLDRAAFEGVQDVADDALSGCGFKAFSQDKIRQLLRDGEMVTPPQTKFAGECVQRQGSVEIWAREERGGMVITGLSYLDSRDMADLHIPAQLAGKPVVGLEWEFREGVDRDAYADTIHLPDSIRMEEIHGRYHWNRIVLEPTDDPALIGREGCLLTADGKILLAVMDARSYTCTVPQGVEIITSWAFRESRVRHIILPEGVREIGSFAFFNATLRSVQLPGTLRRIGNSAFSLTLLDEVVLPEGVEHLGDEAFRDSLIRSLYLPDSLQDIGVEVTENCSRIENVRLPQGFTELPQKPVWQDPVTKYIPGAVRISMTEQYAVYARRTEAGMEVEYVLPLDDGRIDEVFIPDDVDGVPIVAMKCALNVPRVRISMLSLPDSIRWIDLEWTTVLEELTVRTASRTASGVMGTFLVSADGRILWQQLVRKATDVVVPDGVKRIMGRAFENCMVERVVIPTGIEYIAPDAFGNCPNLRELVLPEGCVRREDGSWTMQDASAT